MANDKTTGAKRLNLKQWTEMRGEFLAGVTVADLSEKYGVTKSAIYQRFKRFGIDVVAVTNQQDRERGEKEAEEKLKRIKQTRDMDFRLSEHLEKLAINVQNDKSLKESERGDRLKNIQRTMNIVSQAWKNKRSILGLDAENKNVDAILPTLPIREMTDLEEAALRKRQEQEAQGVVFDDDGNPILDADPLDDDEPEDDRVIEDGEDGDD